MKQGKMNCREKVDCQVQALYALLQLWKLLWSGTWSRMLPVCAVHTWKPIKGKHHPKY